MSYETSPRRPPFGTVAPWGLANAGGGFVQATIPISLPRRPLEDSPAADGEWGDVPLTAEELRDKMIAVRDIARAAGFHPNIEALALAVRLGAIAVRGRRVFRLWGIKSGGVTLARYPHERLVTRAALTVRLRGAQFQCSTLALAARMAWGKPFPATAYSLRVAEGACPIFHAKGWSVTMLDDDSVVAADPMVCLKGEG